MSKKIRISYSSVNDFKECPEKMFLKKKWKNKKQSSALKFGAAVEAGIEALLLGKPYEEACNEFHDKWYKSEANKYEDSIQVFDNEYIFYYNSDFDKEILTLNDFDLFDEWCDNLNMEQPEDYLAFVSSVQKDIKEEVEIDPTTLKLYNRIMWTCCDIRGPYMIKAFERDILPTVEDVLACQERITIVNKEGDEADGTIDFKAKLLELPSAAVMDLKTASRPYDDHKLESSDQLRIYASAVQLDYIGYWVVIKKLKHDKSCNKCGHIRENYRLRNCSECKGGKYTETQTKGETQTLIREFNKADQEDVLEDFSEVLNAIANQARWKNPNSCFNFNTKCEFYDHCWKRKALEKMDHLEKK